MFSDSRGPPVLVQTGAFQKQTFRPRSSNRFANLAMFLVNLLSWDKESAGLAMAWLELVQWQQGIRQEKAFKIQTKNLPRKFRNTSHCSNRTQNESMVSNTLLAERLFCLLDFGVLKKDSA